MTIQVASLCVSITALVTSAVGWFIVHTLSLRTQRLALINSLMNEARIALSAAIRELHDNCLEIITRLGSLKITDEIPLLAADANRRHNEIASIRKHSFDGSMIKWAKIFEEYECLFPETANVRV